jgi:hypothetical protein
VHEADYRGSSGRRAEKIAGKKGGVTALNRGLLQNSAEDFSVLPFTSGGSCSHIPGSGRMLKFLAADRASTGFNELNRKTKAWHESSVSI